VNYYDFEFEEFKIFEDNIMFHGFLLLVPLSCFFVTSYVRDLLPLVTGAPQEILLGEET